MKKLLILLLVATLLIPNFALAQNGESVEYAELDTVTRAEFARVVAMMLNFGNPSESGLNTAFNDIPQGHWARGYIALAFTLNVVHGNGDGTFRPDDAITFQEAIVMLMRALEYQPMANAQGGFPIGYMIAAVSSGLTRNVGSVSMTAFVTRDLARTLVNDALDTPILQPPPLRTSEVQIIDQGPPPPPITLRNTVWNNQPVYFDGENFIILENE